MKLRLIQTAGFIGRSKIAEKELDEGQELTAYLNDIFKKTGNQVETAFGMRDKEVMLLECNGKSLPLHALKPNMQLAALIQEMTQELRYQ